MPELLTAPLFPLPNTILFPEVLVPLYVFEPRYRTMVSEVLDQAGHLAIPRIMPGFEADSLGNPPLCKIVGVGQIVDYETHEDGTCHISVLGRSRGILKEELPRETYRRARIEILEDPPVDLTVLNGLKERMIQTLEGFRQVPPYGRVVPRFLEFVNDDEVSFASIVHNLIGLLIGNANTRQSLLETEGLERRTRRFLTELEQRLEGADSTSPTQTPDRIPDEVDDSNF